MAPGTPIITSDILLAAYSKGWFPMVHADGITYWHDPDPRAIFELDALRPDRRLRRFLRASGYSCTVDRAFEQVIRACAEREERWIDEELIQAYIDLHAKGHAMSSETWLDGVLVGGIYGVCLGKAFFGESMFSRRSNASKAALHHIADHIRSNAFLLFDTQYRNAHTAMLGAIEIPRAEFRRRLSAALLR